MSITYEVVQLPIMSDPLKDPFETSPLLSPSTAGPLQTTSDSLPSSLHRSTRVSRPPDQYGYIS